MAGAQYDIAYLWMGMAWSRYKIFRWLAKYFIVAFACADINLSLFYIRLH